MAEQSDLERKWQDMKDHVTKSRPELDGMAICHFAKLGYNIKEHKSDTIAYYE